MYFVESGLKFSSCSFIFPARLTIIQKKYDLHFRHLCFFTRNFNAKFKPNIYALNEKINYLSYFDHWQCEKQRIGNKVPSHGTIVFFFNSNQTNSMQYDEQLFTETDRKKNRRKFAIKHTK